MTTREYSLFELQSLKGRLLPLLAGALVLLLIVWVVAAPAESRLGSVVKLVYVHGALVWAGLLTFSLAGLLGLVALALRLTGPATGRAASWLRGARSAGLAALVVDHPDLTALAQVLMGVAPWVVVNRAQAIRHPVDPIGGSTSTSIQGFYLLIVVTVIALALTLVAWLWAGAELAPRRR